MSIEKRLYIVFSEDETVQSEANNIFPDRFRLDRHTVLVRTEMVAEDVAEKIGILVEGESKNGVVIKANHTYVGYFDAKLWDWLD